MEPLKAKSDLAITPNRTTEVILDGPDVFPVERVIAVNLPMSQIAHPVENKHRTSSSTDPAVVPGTNVTFSSSHGWHLASQFEEGFMGFETAMFDAGEIPLSVHPVLLSREVYRSGDDLSGVSTSTYQRESGFRVYQKEIAAGGTFNVELDADRAAFPPASMPQCEIQPLKRIAVSSGMHYPDEQIRFSYVAYGHGPWDSRSAIVRVFFSGPAGNDFADGTAIGLGQYHLTILGQGRCILHERLKDGSSYLWKQRFDFVSSAEGRSHGFVHHMVIGSNTIKDADGYYQGDTISFRHYELGSESASATQIILDSATSLAKSGLPEMVKEYRVPNPKRYQPQPERLRVDDRVDSRTQWHVDARRYYRNGSLITISFDVSTSISSDKPITFSYTGHVPPGTSVNIRAFDAETNNELTPTGVASSTLESGVKQFDPTSGRSPNTPTRSYTRTKFYAILELTSDDGVNTPVIRSFRVDRDEVLGDATGTAANPKIIKNISITGQDYDPSHATASLQVVDPKDELVVLQTRADVPISINVKYDPTDNTKKSTLFSGYMIQAKRAMRGGADKGLKGNPRPLFPANRWSDYSLTCTGEWKRLMEAKVMKGLDFSRETLLSASRPWKVTEIIKYLLRDAGYAPENIDVPDIDTRLFTQKGEPTLIEPYAEIYPVISKLAFMYLGAWLTWDPNASGSATPKKMGMWRLKLPTRPDAEGQFRNLAHFKYGPTLTVTEEEVDNEEFLLRYRYSEKTQADEEGLDGQPIKTIWVRKGTMQSYVVPPEANAVVVTGSCINSTTLSKGKSPLTVAICNFQAAKFTDTQPVGPNPASPDFTNGRPNWLYYSDPLLDSEAAVNFMARRLYDVACHAQKRIVFEAPLLLVTDINDPLQKQPRPLQYGDMVLFNGFQFIVNSCSPDYRSGRVMMAVYELFSPTEINSWKTAGR